MLKVNSFLSVHDNSGIYTIKIINFLKKKNKLTSYITVGDLILGVIYDLNLYKKLKIKKKDKITSIVVCVKKKYSKFNGMHIHFGENRCIAIRITRFITPLASHLYTSLFYELKYLKKYKTITTKSYPFF